MHGTLCVLNKYVQDVSIPSHAIDFQTFKRIVLAVEGNCGSFCAKDSRGKHLFTSAFKLLGTTSLNLIRSMLHPWRLSRMGSQMRRSCFISCVSLS